MKKIVLAALAATLVTGFVVDNASAAQRQSQRSTVQRPARADDGFRNAYNAFGRDASGARSYNGRVEGGAISAPAGR